GQETARTRRGFACPIAFMSLTLFIGTRHGTAQAQENAQTVIAGASNLALSLPPGEWSRVEAAVDNGLKWLASQQAEDGRFPSDDAGQPAVTSMAVMAFL